MCDFVFLFVSGWITWMGFSHYRSEYWFQLKVNCDMNLKWRIQDAGIPIKLMHFIKITEHLKPKTKIPRILNTHKLHHFQSCYNRDGVYLLCGTNWMCKNTLISLRNLCNTKKFSILYFIRTVPLLPLYTFMPWRTTVPLPSTVCICLSSTNHTI
jgi:hypothetical protein